MSLDEVDLRVGGRGGVVRLVVGAARRGDELLDKSAAGTFRLAAPLAFGGKLVEDTRASRSTTRRRNATSRAVYVNVSRCDACRCTAQRGAALGGADKTVGVVCAALRACGVLN